MTMQIYRVQYNEGEFAWPRVIGYWVDELEALKAAGEKMSEVTKTLPMGYWQVRPESSKVNSWGTIHKILYHWYWRPVEAHDPLDLRIMGPTLYLEGVEVNLPSHLEDRIQGLQQGDTLHIDLHPVNLTRN